MAHSPACFPHHSHYCAYLSSTVRRSEAIASVCNYRSVASGESRHLPQECRDGREPLSMVVDADTMATFRKLQQIGNELLAERGQIKRQQEKLQDNRKPYQSLRNCVQDSFRQMM